MKWNKDQEKAIYSEGKNILVSASAGAGKTSILVERLLNLSTREDNPIDLNRIIAMTFTDAAASEMKKRLSEALSKKLNEPGVNKDQIKKQLVLLNTAQISTIHSFCVSIIKKYYDVINLDPAIVENTLSEAQVADIKNKAFKEIFLEYSKTNDVIDLLEIFTPQIFDIEKIGNHVLNIVSYAKSSFDEEAWYKNALENYKKIRIFDDFNNNIKDYFFDFLDFKLDNIINKFDIMLLNHENQTDEEEVFMVIKEKLTILKSYIQEKNYILFYRYLISLIEIKLKQRNLSENYKEAKKDYLDSLKDLISILLDEEDFIKQNNIMTKYVVQLIDLARLVSLKIRDLKLENKGYDFDDMEHYAYQILSKNDNMIAKQVRETLDEVLIDEFQDTNEIQNEIVKLISKGNNIFRVGDVKQSIYKFRKAKPDIMRSLMKEADFIHISLKNNYRSKKNIVQFTNELFNKIMNVDGLKDTYTGNDRVEIGIEDQENIVDSSIKLFAIKEPDKSIDYSSKEIKAYFIANKIKEIYKSKNYKYKDFCILLRNNDDKKYLKDAFEKYSIPYFIDAKSGFSNSWMNIILTSFLRLIVDSDDEEAMVTLLTSVIYNNTEDDLAYLKITYGSIKNGLRETNHKLLNDINLLKNTYKYEGICWTLDNISLLDNFINYKVDNQQRTNFDLFFQKALDFEKNSTSLIEFLELLSYDESAKSSEAIVIGPDDDVVRVMTIHQSKGLQFRVVFVWGRSRGGKIDSPTIRIDDDLGIALLNYNLKSFTKSSSVQYLALMHKYLLEDNEELIRILYVALTRAREEMYIVDTVKDVSFKDINKNYILDLRGNFTSLLISTIKNSEFCSLECIDTYDFINEDDLVEKYYVHKKLPILKNNIEKEKELISPSKDGHEFSLELNLYKSDKFTERGSLMHEYMEILPDKIWDKEDISKINLDKADKEKLINFNKSDLFKKCLSMTIYHEFPFIIKKDTSIINGIMDFVAIKDEEIILIDFKSDRYTSEEKLLSLYKNQLKMYKNALSILYPDKKIKAYIYSFDLNKEIEVK